MNKELVIVSMTQVSLQYPVRVQAAPRCPVLRATQKLEVMEIPL